MSALATLLRQRAQQDVQQMSAAERIRLAFSLGDDDVRLLSASSGVEITEAERRVAASRQTGRRLSASASPS